MSSELCNLNFDDVASAVTMYNNIIQGLVDKHAPQQHSTITIKSSAPWYNSSIRKSKVMRRKAEKQWRASKLPSDYEKFKIARTQVNKALHAAKKEYYQNKIAKTSNQKELFQVAKSLLCSSADKVFPSEKTEQELANAFSEFFTNKIQLIRDGLHSVPPRVSEGNDPQLVSQILDSFNGTNEAEVSQTIRSMATKSCGLDPLPTWLLKECLSVLLPFITKVVNLSLSSGSFPVELKQALVCPLLKKPTLEKDEYKNHRPVSNLPFLSKIIERVVAKRLNSHILDNGLRVTFQSAYSKHHSTETALLRVKNDLCRMVDNGGVAVLVLLDLSAAFDTTDHDVLLRRLREGFGVTGTALSWFSSYLQERKESIKVGDCLSKERHLCYGVPQGSVLGPLLFTLYTSELSKIIENHGVQYHFYADDTQLYLAFNPRRHRDADDAVQLLERCLDDVGDWMQGNFLQLNPSKTEVLFLSTRPVLKKTQFQPVSVCKTFVSPSSKVRNLGVFFDTSLCMEDQINATCRSAFYHLRNISKIRTYLDRSSAEKIIHAFVTSRLDYCNSLLYGVSQSLLERLQRVQNMAARIITGTSKYEHITPVLQALYWLPVRSRIQYKIYTIVYKYLHNIAPTYLSDLLQAYQTSRQLRSSQKNLLQVPKCRLKTFGDLAFSSYAPRMWNSLPEDIKLSSSLEEFKMKLKTYLFVSNFN